MWGLGCVFSEIVPRLLGIKPETMKLFWLSNGSKIDSYAENPEATDAWFTHLSIVADDQPGVEADLYWLLAIIKHLLLERDRFLRPTAAQVLASLTEMDQLYRDETWVGKCCRPKLELSPSRQSWFHMDVLDQRLGLEAIFLSTDPYILARRSDWPQEPQTANLHISELVRRGNDLLELSHAVQRLTFRNTIRTAPIDRQAHIGFDEFIKSWYISRPSQVDFETVPLLIHSGQGVSRFEVQVVPMTLELERRHWAGAPLIALVFDREQPTDQIVYAGHNSPYSQLRLDSMIPNTMWSPHLRSAWTGDNVVPVRTSSNNSTDPASFDRAAWPSALSIAPSPHYIMDRSPSSMEILNQEDVDYLNGFVFNSVETHEASV